jgi:hypothetical protein
VGRVARIRFPARARAFLFTASPLAVRSSQPAVLWVAGALSLEVKQLGSEADHSPLSSAEVKNAGAASQLPHTSSCRGSYLIMHRDNLTFERVFCEMETEFLNVIYVHFILERINEFVFNHLSRRQAARRVQTVVPFSVLNDSILAREDSSVCQVWKTE